MVDFKRGEDNILNEVQDYIGSTYNQHYVTDGEIQAIDVWETLGSLDTTSRDTAIKYLFRYGKKDGKNRKDLLKAMHYIVLMLYQNEKENKPVSDIDDKELLKTEAYEADPTLIGKTEKLLSNIKNSTLTLHNEIGFQSVHSL